MDRRLASLALTAALVFPSLAVAQQSETTSTPPHATPQTGSTTPAANSQSHKTVTHRRHKKKPVATKSANPSSPAASEATHATPQAGHATPQDAPK